MKVAVYSKQFTKSSNQFLLDLGEEPTHVYADCKKEEIKKGRNLFD